MKKIIFIIFILISSSFSTFALPDYPTEDDSTKQTKTKENKNWIFGELGGNGGVISVNYEKYISDNLSYRIGFGTAIIAGTFIPIMVNYSYKNILEFGVGIVPYVFTGSLGGKIFAHRDSGVLITAVIGFKRINKGFIYKLSLTPFFNPDGATFGLIGGISFGFTL